MPGQLQPLLSAWLDKQMSGFNVWADRQLQQEDWKPLGPEQVGPPPVRQTCFQTHALLLVVHVVVESFKSLCL